MKKIKPQQNEADIKEQILLLQDKIDEELEKPEADMSLIDDYFKQIQILDGGVCLKSNKEIEEGLNQILKRDQPPKRKCILRYYNTVGKRAAAIFLIIGMFFGISLGVYATRKPIVEFLLNIRDTFSEIFFNSDAIDDAPDTIETVYTLKNIPDGYNLTERKIQKKHVTTLWVNSNQQELIFKQSCLGSNTNFDNENIDSKIIYIDNIKIIMIEKSNTREYIWNNNQYVFNIIIPDNISETEIVSIICSLEEHIT